ncbi:MAG: putative primosomal protein n, partial [Actinomycetota bacterium]
MTRAGDSTPGLVARVVPDVTGLDKQFDYLVPDDLRDTVAVGSLVRVELHGRRVGGWVVSLGDPDPSVPRLVPLARFSSIGPPADVVELAGWAARRWGAPRVRPFLVVASPPTMVKALPSARRTVPSRVVADEGAVVATAPLTDPLPMLVERAAHGPMIVVHPTPAAARAIANRLRRTGLSVALLPEGWAAAAAGVDVVVGGRSAVWAPCPGLATLVVLDEHDESLQDERTPTWHARDVAIERCRRAAAACVLVSPCPTLTAVEWAGSALRPMSGTWPRITVVDRSADEPWRRSLLTSELIAHLRVPGRRVVCVMNTTGRARLLACRRCRALQRCERCDASVAQTDDSSLSCGRCGTTRPQVCQACAATAMAVVRPGVTKLREELEAAANRAVGAVTGATDELPDCAVLVGTEAVLHRVRGADVVAFLDFDAELLAPRYRAAEQAMALLVRAGRLVGAPELGGEVLVQTFEPGHPVLRAAFSGDLEELRASEAARRRMLGLPPYRALALVDGAGAAEFVAATRHAPAPPRHHGLLRAVPWQQLGGAQA